MIERGHTLDPVLVHKDDDLLLGNPIIDDLISDHHVIKCTLKAHIMDTHKRKVVSVRRTKAINADAFNNDIQGSPLVTAATSHSDPSACVSQYNHELKSLLDKHAPLQIKMITVTEKRPWYTHDISHEKTERRKLERHLRNTRNLDDLASFKCQRLSLIHI